MRKYYIFLLLAFIFASYYTMQAQEDKFTVGILPFDCSIKPDNKGLIEGIGSKQELQQMVYSMLSATFQKTKLFTIVERVRNSAIMSEQEIQKQADFVGGVTQLDATGFIGAKYLVTGNLATIARTQGSFGGDTKIQIGYDIKILDITTGEVVAAEYFEEDNVSQTANAAFHNAIYATQEKVMRFLYLNFKPEIRILEIEEKSATEAKTLVLNGGVNGLTKGSLVKIIEEVSYQQADKTLVRKKEIGQAKIINVETDGFATAQVSKNGAEILKKFQAGTKLKALATNEALLAPVSSPATKKKKERLNDFY